jgi:hypothetical protein
MNHQEDSESDGDEVFAQPSKKTTKDRPGL